MRVGEKAGDKDEEKEGEDEKSKLRRETADKSSNISFCDRLISPDGLV